MVSRRCISLGAGFVLTLFAQLRFGTDNVSIRVRDRETHRAVAAHVRLVGPEETEFWTDQFGRVTSTLAPGEYRVEVFADKYKNLRTHIAAQLSRKVALTVMLDREMPPEEQLPHNRAGKFQVGHTLVDGYVVDDETG